MTKKFKMIAILFTVAITAVFISCNKIAEPVIDVMELGVENNHIAYIGTDFHVQAELVAEGKIDKVTVEIHQEEGGTDEIKVDYDEFTGLKNTAFHKHIDIPETTVAGDYHFHLTVTDQEGNSTTFEAEISIEELVDEEAPELNISTAPDNGQNFGNGETILISGTVSDNIGLGGMVAALVYEDDGIADADVSGGNSQVIVMLHTHDFDEPDESAFSASIEVGAENDNNMEPAPIEGDNAWKNGNYYILVKVKDLAGNWTISNHYPIVINL